MSSDRERVLEGGGLRVRFYWWHDRYAHEVCLFDGRAWKPILVSIEGTAEDDWPPSPPFQSLDVPRKEATGQLAFLVGMAGKSHWSASVELEPATGSVNFDVACRVRASDGSAGLRSRYDLLGPVDARYARHMIVRGPSPSNTRLRLEIDETDSPARLVESPGCVAIEPQTASPGAAAQTIVWRYTIFSLPHER